MTNDPNRILKEVMSGIHVDPNDTEDEARHRAILVLTVAEIKKQSYIVEKNE